MGAKVCGVDALVETVGTAAVVWGLKSHPKEGLLVGAEEFDGETEVGILAGGFASEFPNEGKSVFGACPRTLEPDAAPVEPGTDDETDGAGLPELPEEVGRPPDSEKLANGFDSLED